MLPADGSGGLWGCQRAARPAEAAGAVPGSAGRNARRVLDLRHSLELARLEGAKTSQARAARRATARRCGVSRCGPSAVILKPPPTAQRASAVMLTLRHANGVAPFQRPNGARYTNETPVAALMSTRAVYGAAKRATWSRTIWCHSPNRARMSLRTPRCVARRTTRFRRRRFRCAARCPTTRYNEARGIRGESGQRAKQSARPPSACLKAPCSSAVAFANDSYPQPRSLENG